MLAGEMVWQVGDASPHPSETIDLRKIKKFRRIQTLDLFLEFTDLFELDYVWVHQPLVAGG
jgi:hypothetical protein